MEEQFRNELLEKLSCQVSDKYLKVIDNVLTSILDKYNVTEKTHELVPYNNDLPNEIKSFLVCKSMKGLTKTSLQHYKRTLTHFTQSVNKDIKLLSTNDIRLYILSYEQTRNIGKSTLDDKRRVLNSFYSWMIREELITKNPMLKIDAIKFNRKIKEPLTNMEVELVRNSCETYRESALFETLFSTGCRVSELLSLNKSDINYETGRIKVIGKGQKERIVFVNEKSQIAIKKYIFSRVDDNEALFVSNKQPFNRLGKGTIEKEIKQLGIRAKINRNVHPHLIRASVASTMSMRGIDLVEIQTYLGHSDPKTTNIYVKTNYDTMQFNFRKCIV